MVLTKPYQNSLIHFMPWTNSQTSSVCSFAEQWRSVNLWMNNRWGQGLRLVCGLCCIQLWLALTVSIPLLLLSRLHSLINPGSISPLGSGTLPKCHCFPSSLLFSVSFQQHYPRGTSVYLLFFCPKQLTCFVNSCTVFTFTHPIWLI